MTALITTPMRGGEFGVVLRFSAGDGWPIAVGLLIGVLGEVVFKQGDSCARRPRG